MESATAQAEPPGDRAVSFLLDTDICSAYLKGNSKVAGRFLQYGGRLHISAVTAGELFTWVLRANAPSRRQLGLNDLLRDVVLLDVDRAVAEMFGEVRAELFDKGLVTAEMDLMIAATALVHGLTLVTHNTPDFQHVPGLNMADWLNP
jgi:tRNA(fMet)-specific endonuclease VapC